LISTDGRQDLVGYFLTLRFSRSIAFVIETMLWKAKIFATK
jgi:hypothetical protein